MRIRLEIKGVYNQHGIDAMGLGRWCRWKGTNRPAARLTWTAPGFPARFFWYSPIKPTNLPVTVTAIAGGGPARRVV